MLEYIQIGVGSSPSYFTHPRGQRHCKTKSTEIASEAFFPIAPESDKYRGEQRTNTSNTTYPNLFAQQCKQCYNKRRFSPTSWGKSMITAPFSITVPNGRPWAIQTSREARPREQVSTLAYKPEKIHHLDGHITHLLLISFYCTNALFVVQQVPNITNMRQDFMEKRKPEPIPGMILYPWTAYPRCIVL